MLDDDQGDIQLNGFQPSAQPLSVQQKAKRSRAKSSWLQGGIGLSRSLMS